MYTIQVPPSIIAVNVLQDDLTLFLSREFTKICCASGADSPVAWCLSTPGFGIDLDWQVQQKLDKVITDLHNNTADFNPALAWCALLTVVDEYRCVEDVPLMEVYQFRSSGGVKVVNFEIQ